MSSGKPNLENLARAKQLNAEPPSGEQIGRLLASAEAQLRDSRNTALSAPSRFMLAYNAAHALALDKYHDRRNASEYEGAPPASTIEAEDMVKLTGELHWLVLARVKQAK